MRYGNGCDAGFSPYRSTRLTPVRCHLLSLGSDMQRREFIMLLGGAASACPLIARAQEPGRTYRLGVLLPVARDEPAMVAFLDELRLHGFVEGRNLAILPGGLQFRNEQITELVSAMVKAAPDARGPARVDPHVAADGPAQ